MKKVKLEVEEKLTYKREIDVFVPDDMDKDELEDVLSQSERVSDSLDEFVWRLRHFEIVCGAYDDSLDYPFDTEIECEQYEFVHEEEV